MPESGLRCFGVTSRCHCPMILRQKKRRNRRVTHSSSTGRQNEESILHRTPSATAKKEHWKFSGDGGGGGKGGQLCTNIACWKAFCCGSVTQSAIEHVFRPLGRRISCSPRAFLDCLIVSAVSAEVYVIIWIFLVYRDGWIWGDINLGTNTNPSGDGACGQDLLVLAI